MEPWVEANTLNGPKRAGVERSCREPLVVARSNSLPLDRELRKSGLPGETVAAPTREAPAHLDVGLQVIPGRADAGPWIRRAALIGPDFMARRWQRFGPVASPEAPFEEGARCFRSRLHDPGFTRPAAGDGVPGGDLGGSDPMFRPRKPGGGFPEIPPRKGAVS